MKENKKLKVGTEELPRLRTPRLEPEATLKFIETRKLTELSYFFKSLKLINSQGG